VSALPISDFRPGFLTVILPRHRARLAPGTWQLTEKLVSTTETTQRGGLLFAGLCALNGAFVPAVAKFTTDRADPFFVAAATTLFAGLAAAVMLGARRELSRLVQRETAPLLILLGALGTTLPFILFFVGTQRTSAIEAVLCLQTEPVYSLIVAWLFLGHRLTVRRVTAALVLMTGIILAVGVGGLSDPLGVTLLLLTPLSWQICHLLTLRGMQNVEPYLLTGARYVYGGALVALAAAAFGGPDWMPSTAALTQQLPLLALQGVGLSYLGTMLWYLTIARLDLARATAIVVPSIPLLSLVASFLVVGEVPTLRQAMGMLLTAGGVLAFVTAPHAVEVRERVPAQTAPLAAPADPETSGDGT
jgi:drug/metabolite transporter (DMT)-like permease